MLPKAMFLAVGLSAGFVEPLEATGITFTTKAVQFFVEALAQNGGVMNQTVRDEVNQKFYMMVSEIVNFIWLHYHYSDRKDTDYWREVTSAPMPDHVKKCTHRFLYQHLQTLFLKTKHTQCFTADNGLKCCMDQVHTKVC